MHVDGNVETRVSEFTPEPFVGRTVDGYRIETMIGHGGMGAVYRATQLSLDRPVALKVLSQHLCGDRQFLDRFHREADALSRLSHPNIVTVFERGEIDGRPYLVMEFVEGTSLRAIMRDGMVEPAEALKIVSSVLAALEHAHEKGIVHRDIKPENVLLARGGVVKVADFGLSRLLGPEEITRLTRTNIALGTYEYMSPEQREKAAEADERSDLYATGVVLYELLTGELPIGRFPLPSRRRPGVCDSRIDLVVEKSLEKDPSERYQNAGEMGKAVSVLLDHPSVEEPCVAESVAARRPVESAIVRAEALRLENRIQTLAVIDRVIGALLYLSGAVWIIFCVANFSTISDPAFAIGFILGLTFLWFMGGFLFWQAGTRLKNFRPGAPGLQAFVSSVAGLTFVLLPYTLYGFITLFSNRGRLYFASRAGGMSSEDAARDVIATFGETPNPHAAANRASPAVRQSSADARPSTHLPRHYLPPRMEHHVKNLVSINRLLCIVAFAAASAILTFTFLDADPPGVDFDWNWDARVQAFTDWMERRPEGVVLIGLFVFFFVMLGFGLRAVARHLSEFRRSAQRNQGMLSVALLPTVLLIPYSLYSLWVLYGLKGRTYYEARASGMSPEGAAHHTYEVLEGPAPAEQGQ